MTDAQSTTTHQLTPEIAMKNVREQRAVIIDVREPNEYLMEHVAGALSLPLADLTADQLPNGKMAIFYCGAGKRSCTAAQRLMDLGYGDVAVVEGGIASWKAAGLPTAKSLQALTPQEIKAAVADRYGRVATCRECAFPATTPGSTVRRREATLRHVPSSTFLINHFDLFGLRQVFLFFTGRPYTPISFQTPWFYRVVRHPIMLGFVIAFWAIPRMTQGHLLFAAVVTAYVLIALQLEERDLLSYHGETDSAYQRQVRMLVPWPIRRRLNEREESQP